MFKETMCKRCCCKEWSFRFCFSMGTLKAMGQICFFLSVFMTLLRHPKLF